MPRLRRMTTPLLLAGALGAGMIATPTVATAREWDIGAYDACLDRVDNAYMVGDIKPRDVVDSYHQCCRLSGGDWDTGAGPNGNCVAPPAVAADVSAPAAPPAENVDVPSAPPPSSSNPPPAPKAPKTTLPALPGLRG